MSSVQAAQTISAKFPLCEHTGRLEHLNKTAVPGALSGTNIDSTNFDIDDCFFAEQLDAFDGQRGDGRVLLVGAVVQQAREKWQQIGPML